MTFCGGQQLEYFRIWESCELWIKRFGNWICYTGKECKFVENGLLFLDIPTDLFEWSVSTNSNLHFSKKLNSLSTMTYYEELKFVIDCIVRGRKSINNEDELDFLIDIIQRWAQTPSCISLLTEHRYIPYWLQMLISKLVFHL